MKHHHSFSDTQFSIDYMAWRCGCGALSDNKKTVTTKADLRKKWAGFALTLDK